MTTGADLIVAAESFLGEPYSTAPGRTSPTSGYKDCSGLIAAAYEVATGQELGAYVSVTIWSQSNAQGLAISRDEALGIAGACLLMPDDPLQGWGANGHIGFSTGDGFTIESTPAARGGVQRLPATYQSWGPAACLLPGIDYTNAGQGSPDDEEDAMNSSLATRSGSPAVWVYDWSNNTKTHVRTEDALATIQYVWGLGKYDTETKSGAAWDALLDQAVEIRPAGTPGDCPDCPPGIDTATAKELVAALATKV